MLENSYKKIREFLKNNEVASPCLIVDLAGVKELYARFTKALPFAACHYAVKANPSPDILKTLLASGSKFEVASIYEINFCIKLGIPAASIVFSNTIKKPSEIAEAWKAGVKYYACDSMGEVEKLAKHAPGCRIIARIIADSDGAAWPLTKKFGNTKEGVIDLIRKAKQLGLDPAGVGFHVGSQQLKVTAWDAPIAESAEIFREVAKDGITLDTVNIGGGFPSLYRGKIPSIDAYGAAIGKALNAAFGDKLPHIMAEPGRYLSGDAGLLSSEVVLISEDTHDHAQRWIYLDVGKFTGFTEAEAIEYRIITDKDGGPTGRVFIAGPTCDSADIIYENAHYELPLNLEVGDKVFFPSAAAYTTTYSSVAFNGFPPLKDIYLP